MRMHFRWAFLFAAILVIASASGALAGAGGTDRPWVGSASGEAWFDLTNPKACAAGVTTRVDEFALTSHFGRAVYVNAHCPTGNPADAYHDSYFALIAPNGDAIYGTYTGTLDQYSEVIGAELISTVHLTITGGTGRFEGATGSAIQEVRVIWEGYADLAWPYSVTWEGTLSY